jgi:hypothetical protein
MIGGLGLSQAHSLFQFESVRFDNKPITAWSVPVPTKLAYILRIRWGQENHRSVHRSRLWRIATIEQTSRLVIG